MREQPTIKALDGLRAFAVAAVAWSHWERDWQFGIPFGAGVHLFYVLSGFLITGILLRIRELGDRRSAVGAFYIRRALRIFPAFYLTLALAWWADVPPLRETFAWHATYLTNVQIFMTGEWPGAISHFWSLAVEEQFYLIWPWLVVWTPRRWLVPGIWLIIASAPVVRFGVGVGGARETLWAVLTPGCFDSLGVGALLAVQSVWPGSARTRIARLAWAAVPAYVLLVAVEGGGVRVPLAVAAVKQTFQAFAFAWIVDLVRHEGPGLIHRVLTAAPVTYLGRISYGLYLAHGFAGAMLAGAGISSRALPEPLRFLTLSAVTVGVAATSWVLMERPINALKRYAPYGVSRGRNLRSATVFAGPEFSRD